MLSLLEPLFREMWTRNSQTSVKIDSFVVCIESACCVHRLLYNEWIA